MAGKKKKSNDSVRCKMRAMTGLNEDDRVRGQRREVMESISSDRYGFFFSKKKKEKKRNYN